MENIHQFVYVQLGGMFSHLYSYNDCNYACEWVRAGYIIASPEPHLCDCETMELYVLCLVCAGCLLQTQVGRN